MSLDDFSWEERAMVSDAEWLRTLAKWQGRLNAPGFQRAAEIAYKLVSLTARVQELEAERDQLREQVADLKYKVREAKCG